MDMSITRAEFLRLLPAALGGMPFICSDERFRARDEHGEVIIELSGAGTRQLGALSLPTLAVTLSLNGGSEQAWAECRRRFDQAFHRGGG